MKQLEIKENLKRILNIALWCHFSLDAVCTDSPVTIMLQKSLRTRDNIDGWVTCTFRYKTG